MIYQVHVRVAASGPNDVSSDSSSYFTSLPASPGSIRFNPRASTFLTIQIANNPGNLTIPADPSTLLWSSKTLPITTYSAVITRNGYNQSSGS